MFIVLTPASRSSISGKSTKAWTKKVLSAISVNKKCCLSSSHQPVQLPPPANPDGAPSEELRMENNRILALDG